VADSKTYGDSDPTFAWTYSGFKGTDDETNSNITGSANCSRTAGQTVAGSPYTITCTAGSPGDLAAPNYDFQTGDTADFTIDKLDTTGSITAQDKTYDNTTAAVLSARTVDNRVGTDDVTLDG